MSVGERGGTPTADENPICLRLRGDGQSFSWSFSPTAQQSFSKKKASAIISG